MNGPTDPLSSGRSPLTLTEWLICAIASIGFAFDIYELLMLPLILAPALMDLAGVSPGTPEFLQWRDLLFYVPALCGGVFGLLGGYLTDRFGRRRVLTYSILLYAFSALGAGFATSLEVLLILRCTTFVGVCVEFVAAVAWLAELFPDPKRRETVLGMTQAFSSVGGLLVTGAYQLAATYSADLPAIHGDHAAWRYTLISGVIPALPLILIRPFLPESPVWARKRAEGTLKRPSFLALFAREHRRTTIVTTLLVACSYAAAFGAIQHSPQIVRGLDEVRGLSKAEVEVAVGNVQQWQEVGGLIGRVALAGLVLVIARQRVLLRSFQVPGLLLIPLVFFFGARESLEVLTWGIALAGFLTVAQFSFWGNYLPRVFPTHLRGTGESFAANVGGRLIGTSAALLTSLVQRSMEDVMPGTTPAARLAVAAATVALLAYLLGSILCFFLPEPETKELPE
jgi:MFS family permease